MGIYIFTWSKLREYLVADEADPTSENDFGKNIIPAMLAAGERMTAYRFEGYWKDVGTLDVPVGRQHGYAESRLRTEPAAIAGGLSTAARPPAPRPIVGVEGGRRQQRRGQGLRGAAAR